MGTLARNTGGKVLLHVAGGQRAARDPHRGKVQAAENTQARIRVLRSEIDRESDGCRQLVHRRGTQPIGRANKLQLPVHVDVFGTAPGAGGSALAVVGEDQIVPDVCRGRHA